MRNDSPDWLAGYRFPSGRTPPRLRAAAAGLAVAWALSAATGAESALALEPEDEPRVPLSIEHPADGLVVGRGTCGLLVAGRAGPPKLDLVIVVDTSVSTAAASGADVDGDGELGRSVLGQVGFTMGDQSSDRGDSILAAEIAAARRLVERLDVRRTRAALVTFSGGPADLVRGEPVLPDAITRVPLTGDRAELRAGLDALLRETPAGGTHMGAAIDQATIELLGLAGARSLAEPTHARAAVVFSDGSPTRPYGPGRPADNVRSALAAADRARKARVRVSTVALGPDALDQPVAAVEVARRTGGRFIAVRSAATLLAAVEEVDLLAAVRIELRNATSGEAAHAFRATPDGSFGGFIPLAPGENTIEAVARAEAGGESRATLRATLDLDAPAPPIPREYDFLDEGAFGACLGQSRRIDLSAEDLRREHLRRELRLELERERARALERAAEQRKELELEADPDGD